MKSKLLPAIFASWSSATSSLPLEWSWRNPARGQCAVTSLVVQDYLGGDLLRGSVGGESHYWNRLPDGSELDLTRDQFMRQTIDAPPSIRERAYVLSFPDTVRRYDLLADAVGRLI